MTTCSTAWWICLQLELTPQEIRSSGVCCSWPSILIFKVQKIHLHRRPIWHFSRETWVKVASRIHQIYRLFRVLSDQVQEELSRVVGGRQIRVEDRRNMPFTDAVIHESQRLANIVPLAIPHKTSRDVTFQGYFIKRVRFLTSVRIHTFVSLFFYENS